MFGESSPSVSETENELLLLGDLNRCLIETVTTVSGVCIVFEGGRDCIVVLD